MQNRQTTARLKRTLRKVYLKKRLSLKKSEVNHRSKKIIKNCLKWLKQAQPIQCVALYADFKNEVETFELFKFFKKNAKDVVYPSMSRRRWRMNFYKVAKIEQLTVGKYAILEPTRLAGRVKLEHIDVMMVPGIVFDEKGNRLGYGKGYYDRVLRNCKKTKTIGLAFEFQVMRKIPTEMWDQPVDVLITDKKIRVFH